MGVTGFGLASCQASLRGQKPELDDSCKVLAVGLYDGVGSLRATLDGLSAPIASYYCLEPDQESQRVVQSHFPDTRLVSDFRQLIAKLNFPGLGCSRV